MKWLAPALIWTLILAFGLPWIPALGPIFDLRSGIWDHNPKPFENAVLGGLKKPVTVTFDKNGVPHLFAESESDLYIAQGYLTAAYRQFQMDLSTRAADGQLGELVGNRGKEMDQYFVAMGMRKSNRERLEKYNKDPQTHAMMDNYVLGANSWIESSDYVPPEYKIFGSKPSLYSAARIINMSKILSYNLSARSNDVHLSEIQQQLGFDKTLALFPEYNKVEDFVWTKKFSGRAPETPELFKFEPKIKDIPKYPMPNPGQGSNNWVVVPEKSASGTSLLANDTHLGLQLPSIWMELQLSCPEFNAYGVSLVGVPGLVNGFNKDVAWGPTNGVTDVHDYYEVQFTDAKSNRYILDGTEHETLIEREVIKGKWRDETVDVTYLKNGVLLYRDGIHGLVSDFAGHKSKNELMAVRGLLSAQTLDECLKSFDKWSGPIQNFVCADRKNIGWVHAGYIPQREIGSGRFIMDGTKTQRGMSVPLEESLRPTMINPPEGYILSANQKTAPREFPYYMGWDYEPPFRGISIRRGLEGQAKHTAQDMIALQNNPYDVEAEILAPLLLKALDRSGLSSDQKAWAEKLDKWDHIVRSKDVEPAIYKEWIVQLRKVLFDDDYKLASGRVLYPRDLRIAMLLENLLSDPNHPDAEFADDRRTKEKESLAYAVTVAFVDAWDELVKRTGDIESATWKKWNSVAFRHLARLPGFGSDVLEMDGSVESVRGVNAIHGPVYKIVVETGEWPRAWLSVPGGLTGDPFDKHFEDGVREWAAGEMREAQFYRNLEEAKAAAVKVVVLSPAGAP